MMTASFLPEGVVVSRSDRVIEKTLVFRSIRSTQDCSRDAKERFGI